MRRQGVGPGRGLGEREGREALALRDARDVALPLVIGPEVHDGERADARVGAEGGPERGLVARLLAHDEGRDRVEGEAAVGLGNLDGEQAQLARLLQQAGREAVLLLLDAGGNREDLLLHELLGHLRNHAVLLGEVLGREDLLGAGRLAKERDAGNRDHGGLG